ncbi:hypothetical protein LCGC14_0534150 [marine sediment metagenome]|uniref:Uncharacterized protein n=1 Tax=marine sediment metagenome TaxID=412755 RepID=A0A0F9UG52_9ZZZZ
MERTYIYSDSLLVGATTLAVEHPLAASLQELLKVTDFTDEEVDEIIELQPGETWQAPDGSINIQRTPSSVHGFVDVKIKVRMRMTLKGRNGDHVIVEDVYETVISHQSDYDEYLEWQRGQTDRAPVWLQEDLGHWQSDVLRKSVKDTRFTPFDFCTMRYVDGSEDSLVFVGQWHAS